MRLVDQEGVENLHELIDLLKVSCDEEYQAVIETIKEILEPETMLVKPLLTAYEIRNEGD